MYWIFHRGIFFHVLFARRPYIARAITDDSYLCEQPLMDLVKFIFDAFLLIFAWIPLHDSHGGFAGRSIHLCFAQMTGKHWYMLLDSLIACRHSNAAPIFSGKHDLWCSFPPSWIVRKITKCFLMWWRFQFVIYFFSRFAMLWGNWRG